uniref:WD repeat domain 75 n=1 Tax=Gadus morhua TaxID=8049 RepID=A0A8C5ANR8_GADMO
MVAHADTRVVHRGGSKINFRAPVITQDSRFLICVSGECIKVFSTSTEECIHHLQGHKELVTGLVLNPSNHLQVFSCSEDGTIRLWDFTDGILIRVTLLHLKTPSTLHSVPGHCTRNAFTCVACHPKDDCIATGHGDGKIRLWRNFNQEKEYTFSTVHWHHSGVNALCFTPEGTNLLSGGLESVLVQWRYGQEGQKDFLPRLGSSIKEIVVSPDGSLFCTSHTDNKITVIKNCTKVSAVIQGLVHGDGVKTALMVDPRTKALVLNGKPGHLQFYSLQRDQQLYNLDIVQQEYINQSNLDQFEVVKAALDSRGSWLATVEQRSAKEVEISLKLWAFDEHTQSFVLNTTISAPHDGPISEICFSPSSQNSTTLVSVSLDGHFKAWQLTQPDPSDDEEASWSCDFVGDYHSLEPKCCCFSADGSLLAVSFKEVVTVWSPASWDLLTTLSQPPGAIQDLCFGRLSCSKYLLGATDKNLCCWNLLTCSLEWSTALDVSLLLADPLSENVAAFFDNNQTSCLCVVFVFRPSEPRPHFSQQALCTGRVTRAVFAPRDEPLDGCEESSQWLNRSQLYFLTHNMELLTFLTKPEEERLMALSKQVAPTIDDSVAMTPFYLLLGKHRKRQEEERDILSSQSGVRNLRLWGESWNFGVPNLAPGNHVMSSCVSSMCLLRDEEQPTEVEMESEKEEEDSEEEGASVPPRPEHESSDTGAKLGPVLTKAEHRELRGVKKLDYSWIRGLVTSNPVVNTTKQMVKTPKQRVKTPKPMAKTPKPMVKTPKPMVKTTKPMVETTNP